MGSREMAGGCATFLIQRLQSIQMKVRVVSGLTVPPMMIFPLQRQGKQASASMDGTLTKPLVPKTRRCITSTLVELSVSIVVRGSSHTTDARVIHWGAHSFCVSQHTA